jgi:hypothetical protein
MGALRPLEELIPLTVPEVRGLLAHLIWQHQPDTESVLDWSTPRRITISAAVVLGELVAGHQFVYVFDLGDDWTHACIVADRRTDPHDSLGITPDRPLPYWGWGSIPDQTDEAGTVTTVRRVNRQTPS